jgi:hypothetical protein
MHPFGCVGSATKVKAGLDFDPAIASGHPSDPLGQFLQVGLPAARIPLR